MSHKIPVEHGDYSTKPHKTDMKQFNEWISKAHKCEKCGKVVRTYDQKEYEKCPGSSKKIKGKSIKVKEKTDV